LRPFGIQTTTRYRYADDCWSCGRSIPEGRFGPAATPLLRRCLYCGANLDRPLPAWFASPAERPELRRHFGILAARERRIIELRWRHPPATYDEIARTIPTAKSNARSLEKSATRRLRKAAASASVRDGARPATRKR
jgi:hypothetical protein